MNNITADGSEFQFDKKYYYYDSFDEGIYEINYPREESYIDNHLIRKKYCCNSFKSLHSTKNGAIKEQIKDFTEKSEYYLERAKELHKKY